MRNSIFEVESDACQAEGKLERACFFTPCLTLFLTMGKQVSLLWELSLREKEFQEKLL